MGTFVASLLLCHMFILNTNSFIDTSKTPFFERSDFDLRVIKLVGQLFFQFGLWNVLHLAFCADAIKTVTCNLEIKNCWMFHYCFTRQKFRVKIGTLKKCSPLKMVLFLRLFTKYMKMRKIISVYNRCYLGKLISVMSKFSLTVIISDH